MTRATVAAAPPQESSPTEESINDRTAPAAAHLGCVGLFKSYQKGSVGIPVLQGIDLTVGQGEFVAIVGQSGSGKSTLLHLLGTLDQPDAGEVHFQKNRIDHLPSASRDLLRNRHFGMIFQAYHLLPELSTLENVLAPAFIAESTWGYLRRRSVHRRRAQQLLEQVGIADRARHRPSELSGGEMQRTAIARALMMKPQVLLADEPTGNLDRRTGAAVMETLRELNQRDNLTIIMVTHDLSIAEMADRTVQLVEGRIAKADARGRDDVAPPYLPGPSLSIVSR